MNFCVVKCLLHLKTEVVVVFGSDANAVIPPSKGFRATLQTTINKNIKIKF